jgi:hypothetical protein
MPGQARRQQAIGIGADARPRSCAQPDEGPWAQSRRSR